MEKKEQESTNSNEHQTQAEGTPDDHEPESLKDFFEKFFHFQYKLISKFTNSFTIITLLLLCLIAFGIRIFSVIKFESIIHEFDPWFNFRATKYLNTYGRRAFTYWFDTQSWYPLGRYVGKTVFPGLMYTTVFIKNFLQAILIPISMKDICVFTAPVFAMFTTLVLYLLGKEVSGKSQTGLLAALFISTNPSYLTRSVAGSYDNEAISITLLLLTCFCFLRACKTGSLGYAFGSGLFYGYLLASWGGYTFLIVLFPLFILFTIFVGQFDNCKYIAYSVFYCFSSALSLLTQSIEFKAWTSGEHALSHATFIIIQLVLVYRFIKSSFPPHLVRKIIRFCIFVSLPVGIFLLSWLIVSDRLSLMPRVLTVLDPSYATTYAPIVASVSEHQPTSWASFFFDLQYMMMFAPIGIFFMLRDKTFQGAFICLWLLSTLYFSSLMIRLLLVLTPAMCIASAVGVSRVLFQVSDFFQNGSQLEVFIFKLKLFSKSTPSSQSANSEQLADSQSSQPDTAGDKVDSKTENKAEAPNPPKSSATTKPKKSDEFKSISFEGLCVLLLVIFCMLLKYMTHGTVVASEIYSSPTVIMANRNYKTGEKRMVDDFRQAYTFLRQNTPEDSRILAWWDYGYQIAGFSDRITIADNNTWNFTHIAMVGRALTAPEEEAYSIMEKLDCEYVMVQFGGAIGFSGDDINKFPWIVKITGNEYPDIKESRFFVDSNNFVGSNISEPMKNSLMYKLAYYRFWEQPTSKGKGFDLTRRTVIGHKDYQLSHFEEVFTSDRWLVRIYKRKPKNQRQHLQFDNPAVDALVDYDERQYYLDEKNLKAFEEDYIYL